MAASMNKVILIGRLGRDPELRFTTGSNPVCSFSIATDESFTRNDGTKETRTEWHNITVWGKQAELTARYLSKGRLAYIEGSIRSRKYTDRNGVERTASDIVAQRVLFLDSRTGEGAGPRPPMQGGGGPDSSGGDMGPGGFDDAPPIPDDDIPF